MPRPTIAFAREQQSDACSVSRARTEDWTTRAWTCLPTGLVDLGAQAGALGAAAGGTRRPAHSTTWSEQDAPRATEVRRDLRSARPVLLP